ncbi:MAG: universal stress protein [Bacillota bacterium]|nr:universal stress protein [Bacillota bacterium]
MSEKFKRSTPEEALYKFRQESLGHLKIFLGYAPGVGKTYSMLNEANRRFQRGQDIVIGHIDTSQKEDTINQISKLEIIPPKKLEVDGLIYEEMDVDAIIARHPKTVIIDELAHTNAPGSKNAKRYEDVEEILQNGINVITTLNIVHLESLNIVVRKITGMKITEIVPDKIVNDAAEVVVVDISPDELLNRLRTSNILHDLDTNRALKHYLKKNTLSALRELSLRRTAEGVDDELAQYMKAHDIYENWHTVERVMVCITTAPSAKKLIRRGAKIAGRFKCEWYVVYVNCTSIFAPKPSQRAKDLLESHFKLANQLGAEVVTLSGQSASKTLSEFANEKYITQIVIGSSRRTKLQSFLRGSTVTKLIKFTKSAEFHVVPNDL